MIVKVVKFEDFFENLCQTYRQKLELGLNWCLSLKIKPRLDSKFENLRLVAPLNEWMTLFECLQSSLILFQRNSGHLFSKILKICDKKQWYTSCMSNTQCYSSLHFSCVIWGPPVYQIKNWIFFGHIWILDIRYITLQTYYELLNFWPHCV